MLHRAASNAYSWWWASHIRTKQSKWLEQNLQDMGEKVQSVLKLIEEDGDSFAKRAEMYYKKRPELINFVEESYRAYRALAERYDHISTELQNANNTIAYVFPEQFQFNMEDDEDETSPKFPKEPSESSKGTIPKVPKIPKELKNAMNSDTFAKKLQLRKPTKAGSASASFARSGLSKTEGLQEIDRLQKQILALQTEKEFAKSSYEGRLARYWEIEQQIREMQEKVCALQDEFGAGIIIEDDEARTLMASTALKSCQEMLVQLQEKQVKSGEEALEERKRIIDVRKKFKSLKSEYLPGERNQEEEIESQTSEQEAKDSAREREELESLHEKIKQRFEVEFKGSFTVSEMAEKIDELVNKVISLEASVSSQTALIHTLRMETDDLQSQIRTLEDDKATLINSTNDLSDKLREMEKTLHGIQELDHNVQDQHKNLQTHFTEAHCNLDHLSEKIHMVRPDEEAARSDTPQMDDGSALEVVGEKLKGEDTLSKTESGLHMKQHPHSNLTLSVSVSKDRTLEELPTEVKEQVEKRNYSDVSGQEKKAGKSETMEKNPSKPASSRTLNELLTSDEMREKAMKQDDEPDWKDLFMNGIENREKIVLKEYTTLLRNYKDVKKKLSELEKKGGDSLFDTTVQLREFKAANAKKDEQIRFLRQKLNLVQAGAGDDQESEKLMATESSLEGDATTEEIKMDGKETNSATEDKFRVKIDEVLEENLDFWLRFSNSFHQIQKFDTQVKDLQAELSKLEEKQKTKDGSSSAKYLKSDARPLYKHLREIHTELSVWLEKSKILKDELKSRLCCLRDIQDKITAAMKENAEDDEFKFTSFQAAKFQGEILNMKQENNKVADELQAGLDHVTALQLGVEETLSRMNEEFKLSGSKNWDNGQLHHTESRSRVPLRSFIFGTKSKKQKLSFFSCVHPAICILHLTRSRGVTAMLVRPQLRIPPAVQAKPANTSRSSSSHLEAG